MAALYRFSLLALLLTLHAVMEWYTAVVVGAEQDWKAVKPKHHCPSWTIYNSTSKTCDCGDPLLGIVNCYISNNSTTVSLKLCYSMSYYNSGKDIIVGQCLFSCIGYIYYTSVLYRDIGTTESGDDAICSGYQRRGPMCGECEQNHAPAVYHYNLACVECSDYKLNWLKYIAVAYLPLTLFYFMVLILNISVTTGSLNAFVTINQLAAFPGILRFYFLRSNAFYRKVLKLNTSVCTIWNLDFFRSLYNPFCLHPSMTTIQAFSLDYLLGIYPLLLILVTYFFVKLHDRYSIVVFIWRPFYRCFSRFTRTLNIGTSLVQVFATFIILSYVRILNVSFDILTPGGRYSKPNGLVIDQQYWYYNGSLEYFGREHAPYAILALSMSFIFNILPLMLLCLYPFHCFRQIIHHLRLDSNALSIFMDTFYGCYRTKHRDCRHFAAVYILLRLANLLLYSLSRGLMYFCYTGYLFMLALVVVAIVRPYRSTLQNVVDILLFLSISVYYGFLNSMYESNYITPEVLSNMNPYVIYVIIFVILSVPSFYGCSVLVWCILPKCCVLKLQQIYHRTNGAEESLPYRLQHSTEYSPLIS